ncbi:MAG: DNA polymerase III subunit beta [Mycobacteriales bacterium]
MRLRVDKADLAEAIGWAIRAVPSRPPLAILAGMLIDADAAGISVSGFDFEVAAKAVAGATVTEAGRAVVAGRLLADIVRSLPAAPVDVLADSTHVTLSCGTSRFELPTLPTEDYPALPDLPEESGRLTGAVFAAAVTQVAVAAGHDDLLPFLTGIRIDIEGDRLTLAATDRYRLAVRELPWRPSGDPEQIPPSALVPARTLAETAKALAGSDAEVVIALGAVGDNMAGFVSGGRVTTTRLIDGEFPRYRSLLPTQLDSQAEVSTAELAEAVKRMSLVLSRTSPVRLTFTSGEVVLEAAAGDGATATEHIAADFDAAATTVAFNPEYLLAGLAVLDSDRARIGLTDPAKPAVISGKSPDYRYLIMPVRLGG